jgi:hypothetical protein
MKGAFRQFAAGLGIGEGCDEELAIGQRRNVKLVASTYENVHPVGLVLAGRQTEMGAHAKAFAARGNVESESAADGRVRSVRGDDQRSALGLAVNDETYDAAILEERPADWRAGMGIHTTSGCSRLKERLIQMPAPLAIARCGPISDARETAFGDEAAKMVMHAVKRRAADGLGQAEPLEHGDSARHESFAAGLFFGEFAALE